MNKKADINGLRLLLLLVYLLGNNPFLLLHHHQSEVGSYEMVSECEKTIYYHDNVNGCEHREHLIPTPKECLLCDHHTLSFHGLITTESFEPETQIGTELPVYHEIPAVTFFRNSYNKDPPA